MGGSCEIKINTTRVWVLVKWFRVRNGCGFINRNDSKEDVFAHQAAIKKNKARKHLHSAGDGDTVESDAAEGAKAAEAAKITGPWWSSRRGNKYVAGPSDL